MAGQLKNIFEDVYNKFTNTEHDHGLPAKLDKADIQIISREDRKKAGWISPLYTVSRKVQLDMKTLADNRCAAIFPCTVETEVYKVLRTRIIDCTKKNGNNTIMVTSALPGEGKTLTAINLSFAFAKLFEQTVLLVDGDLRQQDVHKYLGYASDRGLVDYLLDRMPLSEIITWPNIDKITLISGGRLVRESTELLVTSRMWELASEMKYRYPDRYVIFDVPPVLTGADALNFAPMVDGILVVVEADKTSVDAVNATIALLPRDKIIGTVLNRFAPPR